jgi:hypothetical protein
MWIKLFFFLLIFCQSAFADNKIKVINWQEEISLTNQGKSGIITIEMQVVNLAKNYLINSYQIASSSKNIRYSQVLIDGSLADFQQNSGVLNIKFNQPKRNYDNFKISYRYDEIYPQVQNHLRQEAVYVPNFAGNANYKVIFNYDQKYDLLTIHNNAQKVKNENGFSLIFQGVASQTGYLEKIRLTSSSAKWQAIVRNIISLENTNGTLEAKTPILFRDGPQLVEKQDLTSTLNSIDRGTDKKNIFFKFKTNPEVSKIIIENKAIVITGKKNQNIFQHNPLNYQEFSSDEELAVSSLVNQAKNNSQYQNLPLHAKLTMFVHDYIKYDYSLYGKEPNLEEIVNNKIGVCSEYARLLNAMARVAKIPAITINGLAINEKNKFEAHAWNALFVDGGWIFVDPTWGLSSGNVSSSHIYLRSQGSKDIELKFIGNKDANFSADFEFEVNPIE